MLEAEGLCKHYGQRDETVEALEDVSFHIGKGEYVAIVGPSGSGKSTLMHILGCLDRPTGGAYRIRGRDVSLLSDKALSKLRSEEIGFVFQGFQLLPRLSAEENVALPLLLCGVGREARLRRARELLCAVGLKHRMSHRPGEMSGGQQQRVAVARALVRCPSVILADEPTGNLDKAATQDVLSLFQTLHEKGHTIVLITHDDAVAARAQRQLRIAGGRLKEVQKKITKP